ncbi:alpha-protein kinase 2 [Sardina pilchardus]|uniref:alpha-protein kinase 2 n=1 Tax=Sardina pilchardus TaxID=27697 RepID=UPI002E0F091C
MTGGHLDTSRAVPTVAQSTLTPLSERKASGDIDQIEYSEMCTAPLTDTDMDPFWLPVDGSIISISPTTDTSNSPSGVSVAARDLNSPLGDCTLEICNDPSISPTDSNYSSLDTNVSSLPSGGELNSPVEGCTFISRQVEMGKDPANPPIGTGIVFTTLATEGNMDHLDPPLEGTVDPFNLSVPSNPDPITSPADANLPICSLPSNPPVHSSTDNITPNTNSAMNLFSNPEACNMPPISSSPTNLMPDTITDFVCDAQYLETEPYLTNKQEETVEGTIERCMNCDALELMQNSNVVVGPSQCSPEVRGVCEAETWTKIDSGSTEEDNQVGHIGTQTLGQPSETLTTEEPQGFQEGNAEGDCVLSEDFNTYTIVQYLKESLTADQRLSHDCEATVEHEALGYCDKHLLMQTAENFTTKAAEISSEGEMAEACITDGALVTHPLTHNFQKSAPDSHSLSGSGKWDQSETGQRQAAVALGDLADVSAGKEGVGFKSEDSDSPHELWLDACQFLAGEENEESILDEWGHSPTRSSSGASTHNTKESGSPRGAAASRAVSDSALWRPPVERWSSTDSWVSALSDWAPALSAHPEDPFISERQPEANMAIQDQAVEQSPDGSAHSGQVLTTLPQNRLVLGGHHSAEDRVEIQADPRGLTPDPVACCCPPPPSQKGTASPGDMGAACDTLSVGDIHPSDFPIDMLYREGYRIQTDHFADLYHKVPLSLQLAYEGSGQQCVQAEPTVLSIEEEGERSYGSLNISDYSSRSVPTAWSEGEHSVYAQRSATDTGPLTCSSDQTGSPGCESQLQEENCGLPQFIMPLAPICHTSLGNTAQPPINCSLPGDHFGARDLPEDPRTWKHLHGSILASLLPPYARNRLTSHLKLPVAKKTGDHVTCELRSSSDTTDTSTSRESSSPAYGSSSSDEQVILTDPCSDKCVDQESLRKASDLSKECTKLLLATGERFAVSEQDRVACLTLDTNYSAYLPQCVVRHDPLITAKPKSEIEQTKSATMSHKTSKAAEGKARFRHKDKSGGHHSTAHVSKKQENVHPKFQSTSSLADASCEDGTVTVIETIVITEKITPKAQGKKKKKHHQATPIGKTEAVPLAEVENGAKQKTASDKISTIEPSVRVDSAVKQKTEGAKSKTETLETKLAQRNNKSLDKPVAHAKKETLLSDISVAPRLLEENAGKPDSKKNDIIRRPSKDKREVPPVESKLQRLKNSFECKKEGNVVRKKAYSDVVREKIHVPKQGPQVLEGIQALPVFGDPQSISLRCKFGSITANSTITWTKGGAILSETQRSAGDESQACLTLLNACSKDLGMYRCSLSNPQGLASSDFHLTSEVLCELVISCHSNEVELTEVIGDEEDVQCAPLLFKDDFLSEQYFGEHQSASIVTEKEHFGEGMHRKAFRATLRAGMVSVFTPGHPCVLKVHNAISNGAKDNEELLDRNYSLATEECYVQNTAREYVKAYNHVAKAAGSFGDVPEIIPIYLVHRPSSDIPYATLEEELRGDFVKYSVKDGKEINLMRRDSEAGQKCCAFQHWVYTITDGNLLVTDMQGVGLRLTDVGIATCKKGYKGFRGNCATSFIDQFKALHQCNRYCELLGLTSLQPKPKRTAPPAKPKPQPAPKKKTFGPTLKGKS